jgi:DNA gyrase subunit A
MRVPLNALRRCKRGDLGEIAVKMNSKGKKKDRLVAVCESRDLVGVVTSKGRHARISHETISADSNQPTQLSFKAEESLSQLVPLLN